MDRGDDRSSRRDGALVIVSPRWKANLVISYPGKPRCITSIILHFILCLCIKFKELDETHLHIYIYPYPMSLTSMIGSCKLLCYRTPVEVE